MIPSAITSAIPDSSPSRLRTASVRATNPLRRMTSGSGLAAAPGTPKGVVSATRSGRPARSSTRTPEWGSSRGGRDPITTPRARAPSAVAEIETTSVTLQADAAFDPESATVEALARALELHDYQRGEFGETAGHATRVTRLALVLAERTAPELLHDPQLAFGFRLHDIGMIGVRSSTLLKLAPSPPPRSTRSASTRGSASASSPRPVAERPRAGGDRVPSRALGRQRLSARPARARHPGRGEDLRARGRVRLDDARPALPQGAHDRGGAGGDPRELGPRLRPRAGASLPGAREGLGEGL